ncbi:MAG: phytanoyl-CoA dioxygenase, partial [Sphingobacteriales bacterium]
MQGLNLHRDNLSRDGYTIVNDVYTGAEITVIGERLAEVQATNANFRQTTDLFAIRQFFKELPQLYHLVFNEKLKSIAASLFGAEYFVVKSIYFDKPGNSNWFVAYHQDLTISVDKKAEAPGYGPWTVKQGQFGVQPPI